MEESESERTNEKEPALESESRLWKYEPETIGKSEFLLDSSLIDTLEFDNDIFAAGNCTFII